MMRRGASNWSTGATGHAADDPPRPFPPTPSAFGTAHRRSTLTNGAPYVLRIPLASPPIAVSPFRVAKSDAVPLPLAVSPYATRAAWFISPALLPVWFSAPTPAAVVADATPVAAIVADATPVAAIVAADASAAPARTFLITIFSCSVDPKK